MEHRTQFSTTVLDVARDAVRIHLACTGCDLMGHVDITPASSADRLIADIAKSHDTPDLFADLPGMWEEADLTGGQTDTEPAGKPKAPACNCFMRGGKHSFKCDLARNGRPPYDPNAEPAA